MIYYTKEKPKVYIETTVVSYLVARHSAEATLAAWQRATRQLWEDYANRVEFVVLDVVLDEVKEGDTTAAQQRLEVLSTLTVLETLPETDLLARKLLNAGAVPQNFRSDAEHIAIATVHGVEYLVSWNHKHINQICQEAGFNPITICTPAELIQEFQMKEDIENYTDPILEECYRMKEAFNAKFNSIEELSAYLRARQEERKRQGVKYVSYYKSPEESGEDT
ncbi:type II toxin-antitoxin system VapC family toxin [Candidatus Poribacteria bacterium]|nr:type II toxin-antitoxin system VapC family toxin [Candidatus Poribacteria bacterium]MYB00658.1 type II toxin-antitoxin system VapC family toxin [Candidatus Poribacteria bacterium]